MELVVAGALSFCRDLLLGDPGWIPHPVVWMGRAISGLEERLRRIFPKTTRGEWAAGALLAILLPAGTLALTFSVLWLAGQIHPGLRFFLEVFWGWQALAVRGLGKESSRVYRALREGTLEQAAGPGGGHPGGGGDRGGRLFRLSGGAFVLLFLGRRSLGPLL